MAMAQHSGVERHEGMHQAVLKAVPAPRISLEAEVPELLFTEMRAFLSSHPQWDQYRLITSALASFLFQNGCTDTSVSNHYLNDLFQR